MDVAVFELQTVLEMRVRFEGICVIEALQNTEAIERSRMEQHSVCVLRNNRIPSGAVQHFNADYFKD